MPDHHFALSARPSYGDLERLNKKQKELESQVKEFELILSKVKEPPFQDLVLILFVRILKIFRIVKMVF